MTLKDVAEMAGVSTMTVSNVINGKTSRVSQKTRDKINSIIEEYNYVPNMNARSLSNNSSHIIGVVTFLEEKEYASGYNYFENPYVSTMIGTIETELHKNGYFTMLQSVSRSSDILSLVKNWNVDGMILVFPTSAQNLEKLMDAANCPIATFDSNYSHPNLINVISDDEKGLYLSTKYMINHGHTEIAFVADYEGNIVLTKRFNGYKKALEDSHIPFRPEYIFSYPPSYEGGIEAGSHGIAVQLDGIHLVHDLLDGLVDLLGGGNAGIAQRIVIHLVRADLGGLLQTVGEQLADHRGRRTQIVVFLIDHNIISSFTLLYYVHAAARQMNHLHDRLHRANCQAIVNLTR